MTTPNPPKPDLREALRDLLEIHERPNYQPIGGCTCAGPDGPCEACVANEAAHDEWLQERRDAVVNARAALATPAQPADRDEALSERIERVRDLVGDYGEERGCVARNGWSRHREPGEILAAINEHLDALAAPPVEQRQAIEWSDAGELAAEGARELWVHDLDGPTETIHDKRESYGEDSEWTVFRASRGAAQPEPPSAPQKAWPKPQIDDTVGARERGWVQIHRSGYVDGWNACLAECKKEGA